MADAQLFYLPGGASITVKVDGSVMYSYHEDGTPYATDEDITRTSLGILLRKVLRNVPEAVGSLGQAPNVRTLRMNVGNESVNERTYLRETSQKTKFSEQVEQTLLAANIPLDHVRYLASFSGIRSAVENSSNPAASALTILNREKHQKALPAWLLKNPSPGDSHGSDRGDSAAPDSRPPDLRCGSCEALLHFDNPDEVYEQSANFIHRQDGEICWPIEG